MKKSVIKVNVGDEKQQRGVLRTVSKLPGIKDLAVDIEKGTLTVTGTVDPVCVMKKLRKCGKYAKLDSVGDPPKKEEKDEKKPECCLWPCPPPCTPYPYAVCHVEDNNPCAII